MDSIDFAIKIRDQLLEWRKDFHRYPEPAWLEYRTAAKVASVLDFLGYDLKVGDDALDLSARMGVPDNQTMKEAVDRAVAEGAPKEWVQKMAFGRTAIVATLKGKKAPLEGAPPPKTIAFRFDMDCVEVDESAEEDHRPLLEGWASQHKGCMHACGHDGHMAIGLALASFFKAYEEDFSGTVKLIFQPGEEGVRGAKAMVAAGIVNDVDYFFGFHLGLDRDLRDAMACSNKGFLATSKIDVAFTGRASHGGNMPEYGHNALLAAATAATQFHAIPRHSKGVSRINVGYLHAGGGRNVIPGNAYIKYETRGATTEINQYIVDQSINILRGVNQIFEVEVDANLMGEAPCLLPCDELAEKVQRIISPLRWPEEALKNAIAHKEMAPSPDDYIDFHEFEKSPYEEASQREAADGNKPLFSTVHKEWRTPASEDCAFFINRVIENGGQATYMIFGYDLQAPHHSPQFDLEDIVLFKALIALGAIGNYFLKDYGIASEEKPGPQRTINSYLPTKLRENSTLGRAEWLAYMENGNLVKADEENGMSDKSGADNGTSDKNATEKGSASKYGTEGSSDKSDADSGNEANEYRNQRKVCTYTKEQIDVVRDHIIDHLGNPDDVLNLDDKSLSPISLFIYKPKKARPFYTIVTHGMGAYIMNGSHSSNEESLLNRVELIMYISKNWHLDSPEDCWSWPVTLLSNLTQLPSLENTFLTNGTIVSNDKPFGPGTTLDSVFLLSKLPEKDEFTRCDLNGTTPVTFLQAFPIYKEETYYGLTKGSKDLYEKLLESKVFVPLHKNRANSCRKEINLN